MVEKLFQRAVQRHPGDHVGIPKVGQQEAVHFEHRCHHGTSLAHMSNQAFLTFSPCMTSSMIPVRMETDIHFRSEQAMLWVEARSVVLLAPPVQHEDTICELGQDGRSSPSIAQETREAARIFVHTMQRVRLRC